VRDRSAAGGPLLVVAESLPAQSSGTSIVLRRLLENFPAEDVVLLARRPEAGLKIESRSLPYRCVIIPALPSGIRGERFWRLASTIPGVVTGLRAVRRFMPAAILAVFPYESSLLLGYTLHRLSGLPLLAYFCDLYLEDHRSGWETRLARVLQPRVFRAAARIVAVNQGMVDFYRERYDVDALCVPACINTPIPAPGPLAEAGHPFVIGYSGNVNATRLSSLRALAGAVGDNPAYAIRYFTPQTPGFLRSKGLWTANSTAMFVSDERDLIRHLAGCDALFLPLTFDVSEASRDQLATCFGIKSYEYFLSQRPVLLHSPGDYFIARFFRQWDCGLVVTEAGSGAIGSALDRLRSDEGLRHRLARNALEASRQFEGPRVASVLKAALARIAGEGRMDQ
jgi:glycosyltransferase involved in cell wall biosynthesis